MKFALRFLAVNAAFWLFAQACATVVLWEWHPVWEWTPHQRAFVLAWAIGLGLALPPLIALVEQDNAELGEG